VKSGAGAKTARLRCDVEAASDVAREQHVEQLDRKEDVVKEDGVYSTAVAAALQVPVIS
jgi:hypothetical protein